MVCGNDTIDRYPPAYKEQLTKLLCISKERFEKLVLATQGFFAKKQLFKNIPKRVQKTKPLLKAVKQPLRGVKESKCSTYTPTSIWQTRYSEFWQWQRVSEWHREYRQDEIINKKGTY